MSPLPVEGPCESWATWAEVLACVDSETEAALEGIAADVQDDVLAQVSEILWNLSGRRFPGECEATRAVCSGCACAPLPGCTCGHYADVDLGARWAVGEVLEVLIDGAALDSSAYRVDDWRWLVRLDGQPWPSCADNVADADAFVVTWTYGRTITPGARRAAAAFAAEVGKHCAGQPCQIPQRVTSIVREGVTYTIIDSFTMLKEGRTGVYAADGWLASLGFGEEVAPGGFDPAGNCQELHAIDTGSTES